MQQQLTVSLCLALLVTERHRTNDSVGGFATPVFRNAFIIRTLLLMLAFPFLGLFASGFLIVSELLRESLLLPFAVLMAGTAICVAIYSLLNQPVVQDQNFASENSGNSNRRLDSLIMIVPLALIANLCPNLMMSQCEPEFARVFRRFERAATASSAEIESSERQTSP